MKVSKESMDEDHDHDYPGYMVMVVVVVHGWLASAAVLRNRRVACWCWCWCWPGEAAPRKPGTGWQPEQRRNFLLCYFYIHSVTQPATSARLGPARECHSGRCVLVYIGCGYVDLYKVNSRCRPWQCDDESYLFINPQGLYKIICMGGLLSCCSPQHKAIEHHIIIVTPTSSDFELLPTVNRTQLDTHWRSFSAP